MQAAGSLRGVHSPASLAVHSDNICSLSDGRFRIGLAQKALNLYLKYLWCAGFAARPPHCPVDAIILESAGIRAATPWTRLDSIEEYARLIEALRAIASGRPLAEWELEVWSQQKAHASLPRCAASRARRRNPPQDAS